MTHHTEIEDNLGGADDFRAWKCKISSILEENNLDQNISVEVLEPEGDEYKDTHKKNLVKSKRILQTKSSITLSPMCYYSRHQRKYLML